MSMSRESYYVDIGNAEESQDSETKKSHGLYADLKDQSLQNEDSYTGVSADDMEQKPRRIEEACSDKTSSSDSKTSASQRCFGKWYRVLIELSLNRKKKDNSGSFS